MSIANNIDGSNAGANQLLDLLSLVSNPKLYEAKVKSLEEATAENKKYVELVGPAAEIMAMRSEATQAVAEAKAVLADAGVKATQLLDEAKRKAEELVSEAKTKTTKQKANADAILEEAKQKAAEVSAAEISVNISKDELDKQIAAYNTKLAEVEQAKKEVEAAKNKFNSAYNSIIAKHKAFIESL